MRIMRTPKLRSVAVIAGFAGVSMVVAGTASAMVSSQDDTPIATAVQLQQADPTSQTAPVPARTQLATPVEVGSGAIKCDDDGTCASRIKVKTNTADQPRPAATQPEPAPRDNATNQPAPVVDPAPPTDPEPETADQQDKREPTQDNSPSVDPAPDGDDGATGPGRWRFDDWTPGHWERDWDFDDWEPDWGNQWRHGWDGRWRDGLANNWDSGDVFPQSWRDESSQKNQ